MSTADDYNVGDRIACVVRCVGCTRIGRHCLFLDVVADETAAARLTSDEAVGSASPNDEPASSGGGAARDVHLVGDHVPRPKALQIGPLAPDQLVFSCFIGPNPNALGPAAFEAFMQSVELKPRIGDIYALEGTVTIRVSKKQLAAEAAAASEVAASAGATGESNAVSPVPEKRRAVAVDTTAIRVLARGEVARPGDFSDKWRFVEARNAAAATGAGALQIKQGVPKHRRRRFGVVASFCRETFGYLFADHPATDAPATVPPPPVALDIAGGGGRLSLELKKRGFAPIIVDPRGRAGSAMVTTGDGTQLQDKEFGNGSDTDEGEPAKSAADVAGTDDGATAGKRKASGGNRPAPPPRRGKKTAAWAQGLEDIPAIDAFFDSAQQRDVIDSSSLLVGLHCDGAVNEIIRAAVQHRKSFLICACCVFPSQYPRSLNDGTAVVERSELNQWIVEEARRQGYAGELHRTTLEFDGANELVYGIVRKSNGDDAQPLAPY